MGWLWGTSSDGDDPKSKLDPALREFLDSERPRKDEDRQRHDNLPSGSVQRPPPSEDGAPTTYRSQLGLDVPGIDQQNQNSRSTTDRPAVPPESLFQDGRYAHLWQNYRPQTEVEAAGRSDQDRLSEVIEAYNDRKAAIGRAAIENCVDYQIAEKECFSSGDWGRLMKMCKEENKAFNRCYTMQSRFLKALGYLALQRSAEEEERIQMHADTLYHEMLARERMQEEAKKEGLEPPVLPPLIQAERTTKALGQDSAWARARQRALESGASPNLSAHTPVKQEQIRKRIQGMTKAEQELELQLIAAENRAQMEYAQQIEERLEEDRKHRADRRERGKETFGDSIKRLWGWDK
ncbi:uncharacterized protein RCC_02829 [Ramularia collo-cygni]|uniref:Autophagy protein n=1 Tax=Ramularia collo-cygni TaxID=112498 RepID=A0A2D3UXH5_9PEZI|nr:uncharacterized protein RCC_02829 [Ramularia collo-cygni]CZT16997.1 uncharacterized protein RCC_02829 [Ramularia collo-cygni]